jgi:hypothetical protein
MKLKCFLLLGACASALLISGCVNTIDGRQGFGVPLVKDKLEGRYPRSPHQVWVAAKDVLTYNGTLYSEDNLQNVLEASIDTRTVWVKVEPVDKDITRVLVQVRTKAGGTDLALASEIDKQIAVRLATGNLTPAAPPQAGRTN